MLRNPRGSSLEKRHLVVTWARTSVATPVIGSEAEILREIGLDLPTVATDLEGPQRDVELHLIAQGMVVAPEAEVPQLAEDLPQEITLVTPMLIEDVETLLETDLVALVVILEIPDAAMMMREVVDLQEMNLEAPLEDVQEVEMLEEDLVCPLLEDECVSVFPFLTNL